jgi:hypothetical protein
MGVHLIGVYLTGVHLMSVHLTGMHLISVYLTGVHLTGVYPTGVYLIGVHLMGVYLIDVYFRFSKIAFGFGDFRCGPNEPITCRTLLGFSGPVTALRAGARAKSQIDCPLRPLNSRISNSYS